jgi:hypothetical protein
VNEFPQDADKATAGLIIIRALGRAKFFVRNRGSVLTFENDRRNTVVSATVECSVPVRNGIALEFMSPRCLSRARQKHQFP